METMKRNPEAIARCVREAQTIAIVEANSTNATVVNSANNTKQTSMHKLKLFLCSALLLLPALAVAATDSLKTSCPEVKLQMEQLPDLNIPRSGHSTFFVNGELVVAGGHTNGFVPTLTAEYLKDGEWHLMDMVYTHDFGGSVVLKSGKVLLFGGSEQPIGIGQTFLAELYDPQTHTFDGFGSMERKRAGTTGLELSDGQVVISGNWYYNDGIEVFDGQKHFTYIKDPTVERANPQIFQTASDNALIFSAQDTKGNPTSYAYALHQGIELVTIPAEDGVTKLSTLNSQLSTLEGYTMP